MIRRKTTLSRSCQGYIDRVWGRKHDKGIDGLKLMDELLNSIRRVGASV